jgi:phage FluMu protein Com
MECIRCNKGIPEKMIEGYLRRKVKCPTCHKYLPAKAEEEYRIITERNREHALIDRQEKLM